MQQKYVNMLSGLIRELCCIVNIANSVLLPVQHVCDRSIVFFNTKSRWLWKYFV